MSKKGASEMWWIIIGAVIALVVLIILLLLFTSKTGKLESGLLGCEGKGGHCKSAELCSSEGGNINAAFECSAGMQCCFSSGALKKGYNELCRSDSECTSNFCSGGSIVADGRCTQPTS